MPKGRKTMNYITKKCLPLSGQALALLVQIKYYFSASKAA